MNDDYKDEVLRSEQLSLFEKAEKLLDREYLSDTDDVNKFLLNSLDKVSITEQRKKNARIIYSWLSRLRLCKPVFPVLGEEVIPLTVPILVSEGRRNSLRVYLREHGVFCPIHWSLSPLHKSGEGALQVFRNEVSLVCDQRYEESDMVRMMEVVEKWEKSHPHDRDWFC